MRSVTVVHPHTVSVSRGEKPDFVVTGRSAPFFPCLISLEGETVEMRYHGGGVGRAGNGSGRLMNRKVVVCPGYQLETLGHRSHSTGNQAMTVKAKRLKSVVPGSSSVTVSSDELIHTSWRFRISTRHARSLRPSSKASCIVSAI